MILFFFFAIYQKSLKIGQNVTAGNFTFFSLKNSNNHKKKFHQNEGLQFQDLTM